jgi:hypothetical protein
MYRRINTIIATIILNALFAFPAMPIALQGGQSPEPDRLIVHEWGTFTTVSGADGTQHLWASLLGPSELPGFVYVGKYRSQFKCPECEPTLARMETPVLYFYAGREMEVSVKVDFPQGKITEWYPYASASAAGIDWGRLRVLPGAPENFPTESRKSHYYPARETDAAPVRVSNEKKSEEEKFLFYRGVGNFRLPLTVRLSGNQVIVQNSSGIEIPQVILFENRNGRTGWSFASSLKDQVALPHPTLGSPDESLNCRLEEILIGQGLYVKEARAMIKTWQDSWFEEGLRVYYIVPRKMVDTLLPITIKPHPQEITRVFVGRAEIITPEIEQQIQNAARQFIAGTGEGYDEARKTVKRYGRFAEPILREMMHRERNSEIWKLILAAVSSSD